jgi:GntR family transcriptional regulator
MSPLLAPPQAEPDCYLYRWSDDQGRLLYIGISTDPDVRAEEHRRWSWWVRWAARVDVEPNGSPRVEAEEAERAAIVAERPVFNTVHAPGVRERVSMYLADRGVDPVAEGILFPPAVAATPDQAVPRPRRRRASTDGPPRETQWRQVAAKLRRQIAAGEYRVGERIPTVRQLMASEGRSDNTVSRALAALAEEGLIRAEVGAGTTVVAVPGDAPKSTEERLAELEEQVREQGERIRRLEHPDG